MALYIVIKQLSTFIETEEVEKGSTKFEEAWVAYEKRNEKKLPQSKLPVVTQSTKSNVKTKRGADGNSEATTESTKKVMRMYVNVHVCLQLCAVDSLE